MPVPLDVPGLDIYAPEVPDGRVVLLQGGPGPAKSALARRLADAAAAGGRTAEVWSTGGNASAGSEGAARATVRDVQEWPGHWPAGTDVVVDSFSLLALGSSPSEVASRLRAIRTACGPGGNVAVLVLDDGQMDAASLAVAHHLADGIIQFQERDDPEGPIPFLRIPKWMGKAGPGKNLYYGYDGATILIDTRRRVN